MEDMASPVEAIESVEGRPVRPRAVNTASPEEGRRIGRAAVRPPADSDATRKRLNPSAAQHTQKSDLDGRRCERGANRRCGDVAVVLRSYSGYARCVLYAV